MKVTVHLVHDGEEEELKIAVSPERYKRLGFGKPLESGEQHPTVTKLIRVLDECKDSLLESTRIEGFNIPTPPPPHQHLETRLDGL